MLRLSCFEFLGGKTISTGFLNGRPRRVFYLPQSIYVFQLPCTYCKTAFLLAEHTPTLITYSVGGKYKQSASARLHGFTDLCDPKMLANNVLPESFAVSLFLLRTNTNVVVGPVASFSRTVVGRPPGNCHRLDAGTSLINYPQGPTISSY